MRPALRRLMRLTPEKRRPRPATLISGVESFAGRRQFGRAVASSTSAEGTLVAAPVAGQGSHFVADLSRANALFVVPEDVTELVAGEVVDVLVLDKDALMTEGEQPREAPGLTHVRADGSAHMVDVSAKAVTAREASAAGRVLLSAAAVSALRSGRVPKGDALAVARIAGIQAVKRTPELIPLAHPIAVHGVEVDLDRRRRRRRHHGRRCAPPTAPASRWRP